MSILTLYNVCMHLCKQTAPIGEDINIFVEKIKLFLFIACSFQTNLTPLSETLTKCPKTLYCN